jgi:hypothetical protein
LAIWRHAALTPKTISNLVCDIMSDKFPKTIPSQNVSQMFNKMKAVTVHHPMTNWFEINNYIKTSSLLTLLKVFAKYMLGHYLLLSLFVVSSTKSTLFRILHKYRTLGMPYFSSVLINTLPKLPDWKHLKLAFCSNCHNFRHLPLFKSLYIYNIANHMIRHNLTRATARRGQRSTFYFF